MSTAHRLRTVPRFASLPLLFLLLSPSPGATQGLTGFIFKRAPGSSDTVTVFADGSLRSAVGKDEDATLASGALGVEVKKQTVLLSLRITTTGTAQPLRERHAAAILVPGTGSSLNAGYGEIRITSSQAGAFFQSGLRGYVSVTTTEWTDTLANRTVGALVGGIGIGGFVNLFGGTLGAPLKPAKPDRNEDAAADSSLAPAEADSAAVPAATEGALDEGSAAQEPNGAQRTRVAGVLDLGLAWRTLGGDIVSRANQDVLENLFNSDAKNRLGLEIGVALQVNDLKAGLTYYLFGGSVPGLSRGQVVAGFSVAVPLIKGALN